jgi:cell division septation protein DedD
MEKKRLLIVLAACGFFVTGTLALLLFLFRPASPSAPAVGSGEYTAKLAQPDEYLREMPTVLEEPKDAPLDQYGLEAPATTLTVTVEGSGQAAQSGQAAAGSQTPSTGAAGTSATGTASTAGSSSQGAAKTASTGASSTEGKKKIIVIEYWVQLTSVGTSAQAEAFKAELAKRGISAVVSAAAPFGTTVYRVLVGPYASLSEAQGWLPSFRAIDGCSDAFVTELKAERWK